MKYLQMFFLFCISLSSWGAERLWSTSLPTIDEGQSVRLYLEYFVPVNGAVGREKPYFLLSDGSPHGSFRFDLRTTETRDNAGRTIEFKATEQGAPPRVVDEFEIPQGLSITVENSGRYVLRFDQATRFGYPNGIRIAGFINNHLPMQDCERLLAPRA